MSGAETYCELIDNILCPQCPLRSLIESDWCDLAEPGVTPFQSADVLSSVLAEAADQQVDIAAQIAAVLEDISLANTRISLDETLQWNKLLAGTKPLDRLKGTLALDNADAYISGLFIACRERNYYKGCAPKPEPQETFSGLEGIADRELGAQVLHILAEKGKLPDVLQLIRTIYAFIDEEELELAGSEKGTGQSRAFLIRLSKLLESGEFS